MEQALTESQEALANLISIIGIIGGISLAGLFVYLGQRYKRRNSHNSDVSSCE